MKIVTKKEIKQLEKNIKEIKKLDKTILETKEKVKRLGIGSYIILTRMQMIGQNALIRLESLLEDRKKFYKYKYEKEMSNNAKQ